jgi:hypothetical protein
MNLRKTLLAGALTLGLIGSIIAPAVTTAQSASDTVYVTVNIEASGTFNAAFCAADAYPLTIGTTPTTWSAGTATGTIGICYEDTISFRNGFTATVGTTDFTSTNAPINTPIPAANLKVTGTANVAQGHWSSDSHNHPIKLGDIGHYVNNVYPSSQATAPWTSNQSFATPRTVNFGWSGPGVEWAQGWFGVELAIPELTSPGAYASVLTLTIVPAPEHTRPTYANP